MIHSRRRAGALLMPAAWLVIAMVRGPIANAQPPPDSTRNNLVHAPGYAEAEVGVLGAIAERGTGPVDMVLVTGFGLGASTFEPFMRRNAARYHMLAITLPGFEKSQAPAMPPPGTSYGDQTWTRQAVEAITRAIRMRGLDRPVLVGHFVNGTQVATRIAVEHPELIRALVLMAGTPRYEPVRDGRSWPRGMQVERKIVAVDSVLAPRWFKTVTPAVWVAGNFKGGDYSTVDSARGRAAADLTNAPPLPVLIRYLCEFHASDAARELEHLAVPLLLLQPSFTPELRADTTRAYLRGYFDEPWRGRFERGPRTQKRFIENAGILVMDDQPNRVDRELNAFLARYTR